MATRKGAKRSAAIKRKKPPRYHHGDLRQALLDVALELIAERGPDDFTLREVARRIGVSHSAPYRHFADKDALLIELATAGFEALERAGVEAIAKVEDGGPRVRLRAFGEAYLRFAAERPAQYRVMFGRSISKPTAVLSEAGDRAFALLEDTVAEVLAPTSAAGVREHAMAIMAGVHGLATLAHDGMLRDEPGRYEVLVGVTLDLLDAGLGAVASG